MGAKEEAFDGRYREGHLGGTRVMEDWKDKEGIGQGTTERGLEGCFNQECVGGKVPDEE